MSIKLYTNFYFILSILSISLLISSCADDTDEVDCDIYQWEYIGDEAPDTWFMCSAECGGASQSPINIANAVTDDNLNALASNYKAVPINLFNNGHTLQFDYDAGSILNVNGTQFELLQFHFHALSEHTVDDKQFPLEVHLVHQNSAGDLAVIGIFFEVGNENTYLKNFMGNLPASEGETYTSENMINVEDLLPDNTGYYTYNGSLTTPPCSEIVTWLVMKSPIEASTEQIEEMSTLLKNNFRPVQGLNNRQISEFN